MNLAALSAESPMVACDVVRGVTRMFHHLGLAALAEVPLRNGRRADVYAIDAKGEIVICEVKVSLADLRGDMKWPDYLDFCDRFFWAVPPHIPAAILDEPAFRPEISGVIVADRFDAAILGTKQIGLARFEIINHEACVRDGVVCFGQYALQGASFSDFSRTIFQRPIQRSMVAFEQLCRFAHGGALADKALAQGNLRAER